MPLLGCWYDHLADTAKKSETRTKLRFKLSRPRFSLLMTQEIVNAGYIPKAILPYYLIPLPCKDRNFFNPNPQKVVYPTFLLYARITNSFIGALVYTT